MQFLQGKSLFYIGNAVRVRLTSLVSTRTNFLPFSVVVLIHVFLISKMCRYTVNISEPSNINPHIDLILLAPEKITLHPMHEASLKPNERSIKVFEVIVPDIEIKELDLSSLGFKDTYELPNNNANRFKEIFDPKLRKKLQDLPLRLQKKPKIQHLGVGITLEYLGNGKCIYGDALIRLVLSLNVGPMKASR